MTPKGWIMLCEPPESIMSASPPRIISAASPRAWLDCGTRGQAVVIGPFQIEIGREMARRRVQFLLVFPVAIECREPLGR